MKINGSVLRGLRKNNDLSQEKLAEIVNVSTSTISMWETEIKNIKEQHLYALADYFKVNVSTFLRGQEEVPKSVLSRDELHKKENILLEKLMHSFEQYAQDKANSYDIYRQQNYFRDYEYDRDEQRSY